MPAPELVVQTTYAELLERCAAAAFDDAFSEDGAFVSKSIKERRYWYFQMGRLDGRTQRYVGPETPELLERIGHHRVLRNDDRQRRALVSTLVRSFGLPRPVQKIGDIVEQLARAGVFRLRGVLVGTVAYQTYMAMLGVRFSSPLLQTADIDIAQFADVSVAMKDSTRPVLDVLKEVDRTFRDIPSATDGRRSTSYRGEDGIRVDFLTPARGKNIDAPLTLPALKTEAQPVPFLDYLIYDPEPAVVLHNSGIYVQVPAPQRYAVHKLIVSRRRPEGSAKRDKDARQAEVLIEALAIKRPFELKSAWKEAYKRGPSWRRALVEGIGQINARVRDSLLKLIDQRRTLVAGLDLTFNNSPPHYDFRRDIVAFAGDAQGERVICAISREALDDHFGADGLGQQGRIDSFKKHRSKIELLARTKYLFWPIDEPGAVLIKSMDVSRLSEESSGLATIGRSGRGS